MSLIPLTPSQVSPPHPFSGLTPLTPSQVSETVKTAVWVGDCFIYNNASWRLNYCVGGEVTTMYHLDRPMYLLGYLATQNRVFLIDKWVVVEGREWV